MVRKDFSKLIWIPQLLAAAYAVFLVLFWEKASINTTSFVTELLPSFVILAVIAITWKKSKFCGFFFLLFAVAFAVYFVFATLSVDSAYLLMAITSGFPAIVGILFLMFAEKKVSAKEIPAPKETEKAEKEA